MKSFFILVAGVAFIVIVILYSDSFNRISQSWPEIVGQIEKEISAPPPLRAPSESPQAVLTKSGVIEWTNKQRKNSGLPPLTENTQLNSAALIKVKDMFKYQYFAHESPAGANAGDLVEAAGYEFIAVGENLALGNFANDQILVQAWMDSPGHRANILSEKFEEIGVSVVEGIFEGRKTWLAVQEFGRSLSSCPQPDVNMKLQIESLENEINLLKQQADILRYEIESCQPRRSEQCKEKVYQYNAIVEEINSKISIYRSLVEQYNRQVGMFNACLEA